MLKKILRELCIRFLLLLVCPVALILDFVFGNLKNSRQWKEYLADMADAVFLNWGQYTEC